jgi:hypothetical protein
MVSWVRLSSVDDVVAKVYAEHMSFILFIRTRQMQGQHKLQRNCDNVVTMSTVCHTCHTSGHGVAWKHKYTID